jgi:transcriptional regulator with XRE-family HTH domain
MTLGKVQKELGKRIRAAREGKMLSQEALAHIADMSPTYLSQVENGLRNPSVAALHAICNKLGMSLGQLFEGL